MTHSNNINIKGTLEVSNFLPFFIFKVNEDFSWTPTVTKRTFSLPNKEVADLLLIPLC